MKTISLSIPQKQLEIIAKYRDYLEKKHKIKLGTSAVWLHLAGLGLEKSHPELWAKFEEVDE